jgi:hypothetical protein
MSEKRIAYIVTAGAYSDYGIIAVFSSRERAQAFINTAGSEEEQGDDAYSMAVIEEWEVDPVGPNLPQGLQSWHVEMTRAGDTVRSFVNEGMHSWLQAMKTVVVWLTNGNLGLNCLARDREHAVKVANEHRARALAENQWGGGAPDDAEEAEERESAAPVDLSQE